MITQDPQQYLKRWGQSVLGEVSGSEDLVITFFGEETQFLRFNRAQVRQTGHVEQFEVMLSFLYDGRSFEAQFVLSGEIEKDLKSAQDFLRQARRLAPTLPPDPYAVVPKNNGQFKASYKGQLLPTPEVPRALLEMAQGSELVGLYTAGKVFRGGLNSKGQDQFFETQNFQVDFSIHLPDGQAAKGLYAGQDWSEAGYARELKKVQTLSTLLKRPAVSVKKGDYRVFLGPQAHAELLGVLSWNGLSQRSHQEGSCALSKLARGEERLSTKISLAENFDLGLAPPFNDLGELSPSHLPLIEQGQLKNLLISSRTAHEFKLTANGASSDEYPRSLQLKSGTLQDQDILRRLGTGLFLSNLHYLNWSDRNAARVTGMTRYACFWVEKGEIVGPISNLRFDDSFYRFWGTQLEDLTELADTMPSTSTYFRRSLGGSQVPGLMLSGMQFTL